MNRLVRVLVLVSVVALYAVLYGCGSSDDAASSSVATAAKPAPPPPPPVPAGKLVGQDGKGVLYTMDTDGTDKAALVSPGYGPCWSPDGQQVCFSRDGRLYIVPATGGTPTQFTTGSEPELPAGDADVHADWSADGQEIVFARRTGETSVNGSWTEYAICVKQWPNGPARQVTSGHQDRWPHWSPNGDYVVFDRMGDGWLMWVVPAAGGTPVAVSGSVTGMPSEWFKDSETGENWLAISLDGSICKLEVDDTGLALGDPIVITPDRPELPTWPISPRWSPDGEYLAYSEWWAGKKGDVYITCVVEVDSGTIYEVGDIGWVDWSPAP